MSGPEFSGDCWLNEKFNLGLDFPNVSEICVVCSLVIHSVVNCLEFNSCN